MNRHIHKLSRYHRYLLQKTRISILQLHFYLHLSSKLPKLSTLDSDLGTMSVTSRPPTTFLALPHELRHMILLPTYNIKAPFIPAPPSHKVYIIHYCRTKDMDRWAATLKQVSPEIGANVDRALGEWTKRLWERFKEWKEAMPLKSWDEWARDDTRTPDLLG